MKKAVGSRERTVWQRFPPPAVCYCERRHTFLRSRRQVAAPPLLSCPAAQTAWRRTEATHLFIHLLRSPLLYSPLSLPLDVHEALQVNSDDTHLATSLVV